MRAAWPRLPVTFPAKCGSDFTPVNMVPVRRISRALRNSYHLDRQPPAWPRLGSLEKNDPIPISEFVKSIKFNRRH